MERFILEEVGVVMVRLVLVTLCVLLIMQLIWVRVHVFGVWRVRWVRWVRSLEGRIFWREHGFMLMVVDHHPADDAVASGTHHLPCVCTGHRLLPAVKHRAATRRRWTRGSVEAMRRGR